MSHKQLITAEAKRLGFQLVGITTPHPPAHYPFYESWLEAGYHGEMSYLATGRTRQRRADPQLILPECKSILVLGISHPANTNSSPAAKPSDRVLAAPPEGAVFDAAAVDLQQSEPSLYGKAASYAWGDDYHKVLVERMQSLVSFIEAQVGLPIPNRWYTDTGPILERNLAQRAGLGWIGKNTCLINPKGGSYFLLGEILLGLELEPDPPFNADFCGTCTRCIQACPTACILPNRTLDARRCISYLTIELKGSIPLDLRPYIGDWVFGCDICQMVCPWNQRFAAPEGDPAFEPRPGIRQLDLIQEMSLSTETFNQKFKGTPFKRAKRGGYLRNAAVALGNSGDPAAIPALSRALLDDPEALVRAHAAWALGQITGGSAKEALISGIKIETDEDVLVEIQSALRNLGVDRD